MKSKERILLHGGNLWIFADGMLGPLLAVFTEKIHGSLLDITWAWAIYLMVTGVCVIVVGRLSDRISKEKLLVAGYALTAAFTFGYLLVQTPIHLFIIQAGLGLALSLCNPTWYALFDKYSTKNSEGTIWGLSDGEGKILTGIAIILGGLIVKYLSFDVLFVIMGCTHVVAALYQSQLLFKKRR